MVINVIIKNLEELLSHGNVKGREIVLDIIEHSLREANSYNLTKKLVKYKNGILKIKSLSYDLSKVNHIYVIGAGKNSTFIAAALEEILGNRIDEGVIIEKRGWGCKTDKISIIEGGHPLPDENGLKGTEEIIRIAERTKKGDLVFVCITGGCTALTLLPPKDLSLEDVRAVSDLLLKSGAPIEDINTVRKHLSRVGGGKLSILLHPAEIISLIVVDEVAGLPWGPTVPDATTFSDAIKVLKKYDLWDKIPGSVRKYFEKADPNEETPNVSDFKRVGVKVHNLILANNEVICKAAEERAKKLGINAAIFSTTVEGEAKEVGIVLASIAKEIEKRNRPFKPPFVLIAGGETTVTIQDKAGEGGRNQELALAAATKISGSRNIVITSIGTDGTDGPTDIAGAIVDGYTADRAKNIGIDMFEHLKKHDSSYVFKQLGDAIYTNPTGTNLMDLVVIYVGK